MNCETIMFTNHRSSKQTGFVQMGLIKSATMVFAIFVGSTSFALAGIVFQENFDNQPNWVPTGEECNGKGGAACANDVPKNWTYYRNTEQWSPAKGFPSNDPGMRISGEIKRGGQGKSWIKSSESNHAAGTANYYSDSVLMKNLGKEYQELHMSVWILMDPNWKWASGTNMLKLLRIFHFDGPHGTANPFKFFSGGDSAPIYIFDLKHSTKWGWRHSHAPRCSDQRSGNYYCTPNKEFNGDGLFVGTPTYKQSMGDGKWHNIQLRAKMNSAPGKSDGIFEFWLDDELQKSVNTIQWRDTKTPSSTGWNSIAIGGNWNNWYSAVSNRDEQWYAIDDLVVSTSRISGGSVPASDPESVPAEAVPPLPPSDVR